jgi:hypothetical protein
MSIHQTSAQQLSKFGSSSKNKAISFNSSINILAYIPFYTIDYKTILFLFKG